MTSAIAVQGLCKEYPHGVEALRGISFDVRPGEVFALLGPNGAGKSTTVRILTTLAAASAGRAEVAGFDVAGAPDEVRRRIGYVAQTSGGDVYATGRENVELQGRFYGLARGEARRRAGELLEAFQLTAAADRLVRTYSGGMKRRLDVAIGLVHRPRILFLDEPTAGLDPESRAALWREVGRLSQGGLTILLTTHYLEEADRLAQRVGILDRGALVAAGTPDALKSSLRGDRVRIVPVDATRVEESARHLQELPGVASVLIEGAALSARVEHGARSIPALVGSLERHGVAVAEVAASRPSLDDVYLQVTGHSFPGDEPGAAPARAPLEAL